MISIFVVTYCNKYIIHVLNYRVRFIIIDGDTPFPSKINVVQKPSIILRVVSYIIQIELSF